MGKMKTNFVNRVYMRPARWDLNEKILDFLDVKYTPGPVSFKTADSSPSNNLEITLPGITFLDHDRNMVLATTVPLPDEIAAFLWQRGYYVLTL
jgi:hypothetical protein